MLGSADPRVFTPPLRRLTRRTSLGFEAAEFVSDVIGMELLPWQRQLLIRALETRPGGGFRYRTIVVLVARQNGKTTLLKALALWAMYSGRARLVLGVAQSLDIAREAWQGSVELAEADPDLRGEITSVRRVNGEQCMTLESGARYRIAAATRGAGRGLSVDLLIMDELREHRNWEAWGALSKTTQARPDALTFGISNAGDDESVVLNHLRAAALSGADPSIGLFEWSAPDGCELDDPAGWAAANPGLGHTITEAAIRSSLATDPPAVFRTEVLCQKVEALDGAVPAGAWRSCVDQAATLDDLRDRVALCLDVAPDGAHATLVAAAVGRDDRVRLDVVAAWESTAAVRRELAGIVERVRPRVLGWFPGGPAAALAADLRGLPRAEELKAADVTAVCMGFAEQVTSLRVLHTDDPLLSTQALATGRLNQGDGWRFARRGAGHADAVYAAAGAVHLARTLPASVGRPRIILPA